MGLLDLIDQLSYLPRLYINGNERYVTRFGSLLSILSFISVSVLGVYFLLNYFQKETFSVISYSDKMPDAVDLDIEGAPIFFKFRYANETLVSERYIYMNATYWVKDTGNERKLNKSLDIEKCSIEKHFGKKYGDVAKKMNLTISNFSCMKNNMSNFVLSKDSIFDTEAYYNIYGVTCNNSTQNVTSCFDSKRISDHLSSNSIYLDVYLPNSIPDHFNYSNPITSLYAKKSFKLNYNLKLSYKFYLDYIKYDTDYGSVFQNFQTDEGYEIRGDPTDVVSSFLNKDAFLNVQINVEDNNNSKYKRIYPKLQTVIASIGGVYSFIITVAGFIANFVTEKMMFIEISNKSIDLEDNQHRNNQTELKNIIQNLNKNEETHIKMNDASHISEKINLNYLIGNKLKDHSKISKIRKLTILESILPKKFFHKESLAHLVDKCMETLKNMLSCDFFLSEFSSFEKFKNLILDKNQNILYENISNHSLEYYYNKLQSRNQAANHEELRKNLSEVYERNDCISKSIMKNFIDTRNLIM